MNRCPITYKICGKSKYSQEGLKLISRNLKHLNDFPYTAKEQVQMAVQQATKLSIQGIQPKLSVVLNISKEEFEIVEKNGKFILKPPHHLYEEIPQNEDLTMRLAQVVGIEVPLHGMIYNRDGSLTYFIKRFDRIAKNGKLAVEDFSQLLGFSRETKYDASIEKVISVIEKHCTFPMIEKMKLFRLVIFNFLVGNEDMHLKNYSLIRREEKVELSAAYDLVNTTIILNAKEESALPIRGKKSRLTRLDLLEYFGKDRLGLPDLILEKEMASFKNALSLWEELIDDSFLSPKLRSSYLNLVKDRWYRLIKNS